MINGLLGKKVGMTQVFKETGEIVPVTVIEAGPCAVLQVKTVDKDGYSAIQLGFDNRKEKSVTKPLKGIFDKVKVKPVRFIREIRSDIPEGLKPSDSVTVDIFKPGEYVDITAISIGKGFQGGHKRWHWGRGPMSHGSMSHRAPGSIGQSSFPSRVFKGHHLPGHMGHVRVTIQGIEVIEVDKGNNTLVIKGPVPGPKGNYLVIKRALKKKIKKAKVEAHVEKKKELNPLKKSKKSMKK